jgi:maleate isomerase
MSPLRIGLIIPSSNRMVEQEMAHYLPDGVTLHINRVRMTGPHHKSLDALLPHVAEAAGALADARCDVVGFHCTVNSMENGTDGEERILATMKDARAARVTTTAAAIRNALAAIGGRRIVLLTPYDEEATAHEADYLRACGYEVVYAKGFALAGSDAFCGTPASFWREQTLKAARADADVYFLSCANIAVVGIIDDLERQLGRAVLTSNQAMLWQTLRESGWHHPVSGIGRLFIAAEPALSK